MGGAEAYPVGACPRLAGDATLAGQLRLSVPPPSSSGLGHRPFKAAARVRIPLGVLADKDTPPAAIQPPR